MRRRKRVSSHRRRTKRSEYYTTRNIYQLPVIPINRIKRREVIKSRIDGKVKAVRQEIYYKVRKRNKVVDRILPPCHKARQEVRRKYFQIDNKIKSGGGSGISRKNEKHRGKLTRRVCR